MRRRRAGARLAALLPQATFTGVDISAANIRSAEIMRRGGSRRRSGSSFVLGDYMAFRDAPFDLILSDGVLHYVDAPDEELAAKLAADLAPGGTLIVAMATDCLYNRWFGLPAPGPACDPVRRDRWIDPARGPAGCTAPR